MIRITPKILSIPPYVSTTWNNILSLHVEVNASMPILVLSLSGGIRIKIPGIDKETTQAIFLAHATYVGAEKPLKILAKTEDESFLQHNAEQANDRDLPVELLQKISALSEALGIKDSALIPQAEPDCNCVHCQVANALRKGLIKEEDAEEEIVTEDDLKFRTWDISKTADNLYTVSNPLDSVETYSVYLGQPVGCTCGNPHCEHIRAVLKS